MASKLTWEEHEKRRKLLKRNAERRDWERQQQGKNKGFDQALMVVFGAGYLLYLVAMLAIGVTSIVLHVAVGVIAGIVASYVV